MTLPLADRILEQVAHATQLYHRLVPFQGFVADLTKGKIATRVRIVVEK